MGMVQTIRAISDADIAAIKAGTLSSWDYLNEEPSTYLDKAWHGLHFLLCGDSWSPTGELGMALMGGEPVGKDGGYGKANYLTPEEVAAVHEAPTARTPPVIQASPLRMTNTPAATESPVAAVLDVPPTAWPIRPAIAPRNAYVVALPAMNPMARSVRPPEPGRATCRAMGPHMPTQ